ncbi:MAG: ATP-binding protein, partial [Mobilicoccus sp.]|nr:ATP-binding protein [Mobilicoccus sp.]
MSSTFPFSAVVGMDDMGLALCLSAVSPGIGGVLVRGEKGTAKSTMVRALAAVLPPVDVVAGCRFACDPAAPDSECPDGPHAHDESVSRPVRLVELPVGASEDRVVGSIHLDDLLSRSRVSFEPGLLAQAHRGLLYVDEVNLLPDHLVDTLLDSAAMGRARVEREGVSVTHAARFVLVGTMNPEEGELRPQLLDRFGLAVDVAASRDVDVRVEVVRRRLAYEADPHAFVARYDKEQRELAERIARAEELLPRVALTDDAVRQISSICADYDVDGMRGDLVTARTACAHAAWCGRTRVTGDDVRVAARLALPHRRRRNPFDDHDAGDLDDILDEHVPDDPPED